MTLYKARRPWVSKKSSTVNLAVAFIISASAVVSPAHGAEVTTDYLKPTVSSKACMGTVGFIADKTTSFGNDGACMQCDPANNVCPPGCQALIDSLYANCDGVTTPDGLYYDPNNVIEGTWSDSVKATIKIATERCGCNSSFRLHPGGVVIFGVCVPTRPGLALLTSFVSWIAAFFFL